MTDTLPGPDGIIRIRRTFGWGIFFMNDSEETALPDYDPETAVATARHSMSVAVRHEQDVEIGDELFVVSIDVHLHARPPSPDPVTFEGAIDVPSGRLDMGDASETQVIRLTPGRWSVAIVATPEDHPEHVDIWLESLTNETD